MFRSQFINIVEKKSGKKPSHAQTINLMVQTYLDHSSISRIKVIRLLPKIKSPQLRIWTKYFGQIQKKYLNFWVHLTRKVVDFNIIPPKLVKMTASVLCQPSSNAINNRLSNDDFSRQC